MLQKKTPMDSFRLLWALRRTTPNTKADNTRWKRLLDKPRRNLLLPTGTDGTTGSLGCRTWGRGEYSMDLHVYSNYVVVPHALFRDPIHEVPFQTLLTFIRKAQRKYPGTAVILSIDPGTEWALDIRVDGMDWTVQSVRHIPDPERPRPLHLH